MRKILNSFSFLTFKLSYFDMTRIAQNCFIIYYSKRNHLGILLFKRKAKSEKRFDKFGIQAIGGLAYISDFNIHFFSLLTLLTPFDVADVVSTHE